MSFNYLVSLLLGCVFSFNLHAQLIRVEIESKSTSDTYEVITLGKDGLLVFFETGQRGQISKKELWEFVYYDTLFNEIWSTELPLIHSPEQLFYYKENQIIHLFLLQKNEFQIASINLKDGTADAVTHKITKPNFTVNDFKVLGNVAFVGGTVPPPTSQTFFKTCMGFICFPLLFIPNFIPAKSAFLVYANLNTKSTKEIPFSLSGYSEISHIQVDSAQNKFTCVIKQTKGKNTQLLLQDMKPNGLKYKSIHIQPVNYQYKLFDSKVIPLKHSKQMIVGTFGLGNKESGQGVYFSGIVQNRQAFIQYTSFSRYTGFFDYLPQNEREKVESKMIRKNKRGKDIQIEQKAVLRDVYHVDSNAYIVIHEFYYPQYHNEFQMVWMYGRPVETIVEVFDGYRFTHATAACFDSVGQLRWDHSLVFKNILSYNLSPKAIFKYEKNNSLFAYSENANIHYKIIKDSTLAIENIYNELSNIELKTRVLETINNSILPWYGNFAVSYGFQRLKQIESEYVQKRKLVFFINKIELSDINAP